MKVLAFDLDGTLLTKNSSFVFFHSLCQSKHFSYPQLAYSSLLYGYYRYCSHDYTQLHRRIFDQMLKGKSLDFLKELARQFVDSHLEKMIYSPAIERLEAGKREQAHLVILSCSPDFLVQPIAERLGVDETVTSLYTTDQEGHLADIATVVDGKAKASYLNRFTHDETVAFSDNFDDLPFLLAASKPVAVRPDRKLKRYARKNHWEVL